MEEILILDDRKFEQIVPSSKGLVLLEIYSRYSGLSIIMEPLVTRLQKKYCTHLQHFRLDVNQSKHFIENYKISDTISLLLFKDGEPVEQLDGLEPFAVLENTISKYM